MAFLLKSAIISLSSCGVVVLGYGAYLLKTKEHTLEEKLLLDGMRLLVFEGGTENTDKELWKQKVADYGKTETGNKFEGLTIEKKESSSVEDSDIEKLIEECKKAINDKKPEEGRYEKVKSWCSTNLISEVKAE